MTEPTPPRQDQEPASSQEPVRHTGGVPEKPAVPPAPLPAPAPSPAAGRIAASANGTPAWMSVAGFGVLAAGLLVLSQRPPDAPDMSRIATLEAELATAKQRLAVLEGRTPGDLPSVSARLLTLEAALQSLSGRPATEPRPAPDNSRQIAAEFAAKLESLDKKFTGDLNQALLAATAAANARISAANRLRMATDLLNAGQPLGDLAGTAPALARFTKTPPPTESALRIAFPEFAVKAEAASELSAEDHDLAERLWAKAQTLITLRKGDHVLIGPPAAAIIATARVKLDAGDLPGAVTSLAALDSKAATAMATWMQDAKALLGARLALIELAKS